MSQLSPLDSVFLSFETSETPGHIGGLAVMDPSTHPQDGFGFDHFVDFVAERLALCPRFAWKLQEVPFGLDEPYWVEEEELDLRRHVQAVALPTPGGAQELSQLASYLFERSLDRRLPLWEMFYIEGLQGGRVALLWKVHHCLMDGVSGAGLIELLFDLAPEPGDRPLIPVEDASSAGREVGLLDMTLRGLRNAAQRPANFARHFSQAGSQVVEQLRQHGLEGVSSAPHSIFNGIVGSRRTVAWSSISFQRVKQIKDELGVTVNDVVLALTSDSVRRYLDARDLLPEESLVAAVPVSLREKGDRSMGNQVSEIGVSWATDIEDPLERVLVINEAAMEAKSSDKARRVNPLQAIAESCTPAAVKILARAAASSAERMPLPANAVVSNVPMSPVPIYIGGARIESMVPMSLLAPTQGFNITVLSYCGELHFGLLADPAMVDNVWEIADAIPKALGRLERSVAEDPRFRT